MHLSFFLSDDLFSIATMLCYQMGEGIRPMQQIHNYNYLYYARVPTVVPGLGCFMTMEAIRVLAIVENAALFEDTRC